MTSVFRLSASLLAFTALAGSLTSPSPARAEDPAPPLPACGTRAGRNPTKCTCEGVKKTPNMCAAAHPGDAAYYQSYFGPPGNYGGDQDVISADFRLRIRTQGLLSGNRERFLRGSRKYLCSCFRRADAERNLRSMYEFFDTLAESGGVSRVADAAIARVEATWASCGNSYLQKFRACQSAIRQGTISARVEPTIFSIGAPANTIAAGAAYCSTYGGFPANTVRITDFFANSGGWIQNFDNLLAWEIGNLCACRSGYRPPSIAAEVGSGPPCARF